ncbi:hypothetical protein L1279_002500 [Planomicrobium sp. HSC-17F08]|nr:hypothetical protein [Planomicrobium sp. HSC-17F08]
MLAAVEEAPEPEYLKRIITDALGLTTMEASIPADSSSEKYQSIREYDVSNYEEKPFNTNSDTDKTNE